MRWIPWLTVLVLALPLADAQTMNEGEPVPVLFGQASDDQGAIHLSGTVLLQAVLLGDRTEDVEEVIFNFAPGAPPPAYTPLYPGIQELKTDDTPTDGWMFPINASQLPAGEHSFALHAYATAGDPSSELARSWGPLVVEDDDASPPWPWVLPGETGDMENPHVPGAVTVELVEEGTIELFVQGRAVEPEPWTPPARTPGVIPQTTVPSQDQVGGVGVQHPANLSEGDVLRVVATDTAGNQVGKGLLIGHGVHEPILEITIPVGNLTVATGSQLQGLFDVRNIGTEPASYDVILEAPEGYTASLDPTQGRLEPGSATRTQLALDIEPDAPTGSKVTIEIRYNATDGPVRSVFPLPVQVVPGTTAPGDDGGGGLTIDHPAWIAITALGLAGFVALRSRRS